MFMFHSCKPLPRGKKYVPIRFFPGPVLPGPVQAGTAGLPWWIDQRRHIEMNAIVSFISCIVPVPGIQLNY